MAASAATTGPVLVATKLRHAFARVVALDDVDLTVAGGEILCLVGPSGCGKTTLLRVIAGLEHLQTGSVRLHGRPVADVVAGIDVPPDERDVGFVFQDYALFPHLTVMQNVAFGLGQVAAAERRQRALDVLGKVGMAAEAAAYPHTLSGGQQQRVALARALAPAPGLLLLDEPFSGLDARLRDQVRDDTYHILKESGRACLIVTHDSEEAMFLADRIGVMRAGRIEQVGTPAEIYGAPNSAFVARFFSDVNRLSGRVETGAVTTPFGRVPAAAAAEGDNVEVLIRPEALRVAPLGARGASWSPRTPPSGGCRARVIATRLLGRSSLIHLGVADGAGGELHLHARIPGQVHPPEGEIVGVDLDLSQTFVFPAPTPT